MVNSNLNGDTFCGIFFGEGCGDWQAVNSWTIDIPGGKPEIETPIEPSVILSMQGVNVKSGCNSYLSILDSPTLQPPEYFT